jgi:hypothetical protein
MKRHQEQMILSKLNGMQYNPKLIHSLHLEFNQGKNIERKRISFFCTKCQVAK